MYNIYKYVWSSLLSTIMQDGSSSSLAKFMSFFKNKFYIFKNKLLHKEDYNNMQPTQKTCIATDTDTDTPTPNNYSINIPSLNNSKNIEVHETKILQDTIIITTTTTTVTMVHSSHQPHQLHLPPLPDLQLQLPLLPPLPDLQPKTITQFPCNNNLSVSNNNSYDINNFYRQFNNYSKYDSNIISSLVDIIIDTVILRDYIENKQKNETYIKQYSDYYESQHDYDTLRDDNTLNPYVFNEFEEIITHISTPNPDYLIKLSTVKIYSDDLIDMYTRYGVFETSNFIIKIDDQPGIFTSELELMAKLGKGIISPYNIVLPYYVHISIKNKDKTRKKCHKMHFSIQPRIRNTIALHKWLHFTSNNFYHINYYVKMCITISKSILFIHSHDLVHGDIKPDNILIEKYTNIPYIIDFGLSGINDLSPGTGGTRPFCCPETNNISDSKDKDYLWTKNNKRYDLWSIAFIFSTIIIFKDSYNYYSNYPHGYFTKDKYVNCEYLQRIPPLFREPFMLVLCKKSDINLSNFICLLEDALAKSTTK